MSYDTSYVNISLDTLEISRTKKTISYRNEKESNV